MNRPVGYHIPPGGQGSEFILPEAPNVGKAFLGSVAPRAFNETYVFTSITFLNTPAHVNLGLKYKRIGDEANAAPHRVRLFPISAHPASWRPVCSS